MEPTSGTSDPSSQFDFLANSGGGSKNSSFLGSILGGKGKIIILAAGGGLALLLILLAYSLFFSTPDNAIILTRVGKQQARILQAAETGVDKARNQEARNLAVTVQLSLTGDQKPLLDALGDQNIRISTKDDEELEQQLITAEQANQFDETIIKYLKTELTSYAKNLDAAYRSTQSTKLREVLAAQYKNARFLAGESTEAQ